RHGLAQPLADVDADSRTATGQGRPECRAGTSERIEHPPPWNAPDFQASSNQFLRKEGCQLLVRELGMRRYGPNVLLASQILPGEVVGRPLAKHEYRFI